MFKIGQLVKAKKDDPTGLFKKNEIFKVQGIESSKCSCIDFLVDIGKTATRNIQFCLGCDKTQATDTDTSWFSNRQFAPIDYSFALMILRNIEKEINELETIKIETKYGNI